MAAASDSGEQVVEARGWRLSITPIPPAAWVLSLQLDDDAARSLPPSAQVRLMDDEGLVWGQGPLAGGALDLEWSHAEPPLERLRRMGLRLQIV